MFSGMPETSFRFSVLPKDNNLMCIAAVWVKPEIHMFYRKVNILHILVCILDSLYYLHRSPFDESIKYGQTHHISEAFQVDNSIFLLRS